MSETLVYQNDGFNSLFHTSFILDSNTEARQTPATGNHGRKNNNKEEMKKSRIKRFVFYHTNNS